MSEQAATREPTLWDQLSPKERKAIERDLKAKREMGPAKPDSKRSNGFQLKGYVRCDLSTSDKESFVAWEAAHNALEAYDVLVKAADSGYLLKVGEAEKGGIASLSAAATGQVWDGFVLTAHAGSAVRAAVLLAYKHEVIMQREWSAWMDGEGDDVLR